MTSSGLSTSAYKIQRDEDTPANSSGAIPFTVLAGLSLGLQGDTETIEDQEITNVRGLVDATPVDRLASGQTSHVLRYGPYDALFALALQPDDGPADSGPVTKGVFLADSPAAAGGALVFPPETLVGGAAVVYAINGTTGVISAASSGIQNSFEVGMWGYLQSITAVPGGATAAQLERIPFKVLAKATDSLTAQFLVPPVTGNWTGQLVRASQITDGSQKYAATIEQLYDRSVSNDDKRYQVITNAKIGTAEIAVERKQAITLTLGWNGKDADPKFYHPLHTTPPTGWAAVPSNGVYQPHPNAGSASMAPIYNRGFLWFGDKTGAVKPGVAVGFKARSVRVSIDNQIQPDGNLFEEGSSEIDSLDVRVRANLTATMSKEAHALLVANKDWVDAELAIALPDAANGNMYILDLPAGRIATATAPVPAKGNKITVTAEMIARIATAEKKFFGTTVTGATADLGVTIRVVKVPKPA